MADAVDLVDRPFHCHDLAEDTVELMRRFGVESAIVVGFSDGDIVTPEHAVTMFRTIPGAQLCVFPNAGHCVMPMETVLQFLQPAPTGATARTGSTRRDMMEAHPSRQLPRHALQGVTSTGARA